MITPIVLSLDAGTRILHFVTLTKSEAENLFEWFVMVLDKNVPLNFLDDSDWRKVIKLEPITSKRFKSIGSRLVHVASLQYIVMPCTHRVLPGLMTSQVLRRILNRFFFLESWMRFKDK